MRYFILLLAYFSFFNIQAQYAVKDIPEILKDDVNAIIRNQETVITLSDFDDMVIYQREVVTVLNRDGLTAVNPVIGYDKSTTVKDLEARIYDENGHEIEKFKKKDFIDASVTDGNLYTDNRKMYLDHAIRSYPFTLEFISEIKTSSTAFLPRWDPSPYYDVSTQKSSYTLINKKEVPLITRKYNLDKFNITAIENAQKLHFELLDMPAVQREVLGPHYTEFTPVVKVALQKFQLEKEEAMVKDWKDFGLWQNNNLLFGRDKISEATTQKINELVADIEDPREKARLIYEFMQNKTRYISVQVGIGGWQPSAANEVDELSYGDCKGLTNYTKSLLQTQGIESFYTIVYAGDSGRDIDENFVALQGNHVILTIPFENETVFLECTNQQVPFNYLGDFTDNRKVLMVTPEGGVITKTHTYDTATNKRSLEASVTVGADLKVSGKLNQKSEGVLYGNKYFLETARKDDVKMYYKENWGHLNNLALSNITFENDKDAVVFAENINFETQNYVSTAGDRILLNPNIFNRFAYLPAEKENRTLPLKINRGITALDTININLPDGYDIEAAFEPIEIVSKFGSYEASVTSVNSSALVYKRSLILNSGTFPKEEFNNYVAFIQEVVKSDKSKIVLLKK